MAEPVLKKGSNDPAVKGLQDALKVLGYYLGPIDGVFGADTESAVKKFQQAREIAQSTLFSSHLPKRPCLMCGGYHSTVSFAASSRSRIAEVRMYQDGLA